MLKVGRWVETLARKLKELETEVDSRLYAHAYKMSAEEVEQSCIFPCLCWPLLGRCEDQFASCTTFNTYVTRALQSITGVSSSPPSTPRS